MKICFYPSLLTLLLFSGICLAQAPKPSIEGAGSNELSADFVMPVKGSSLSDAGYGGQIAGAHFFGQHVGVELQGDYQRTNFDNYREEAVRVGPIVRFATKQSVQPYLELLAGYAGVKASYLLPVTSFHGGASAMAGGGLDYRISGGPWFVKAGADLQYDGTSPHTRLARGLLGISYRFGAR